ncbi:MAG: hypothetical protein GY863_08285 [bacterium]|nr:hypothetical protein [bacterium]
MDFRKIKIVIISCIVILLVSQYPVSAYQELEECTVGVASGRATPDGRPMIWKTRDSGGNNDNEVVFNTGGKYKYIAVFNAGNTTSPWMGINEKGFAILNSLSTDLAKLPGSGTFFENGTYMHKALSNCADVTEFQSLLDRSNIKGRKTCANYFVLDASGAAAIFETANKVYWKFDATDEEVAPDGYILRTNFAMNGGGNGGIERYRRTTVMMKDFYETDKISHREILQEQMRDFVDAENNPVELPFRQSWVPSSPLGYIQCTKSICRPTTVSTAVIQGILPGEDPQLTTMWTMLGQPAASITIPFWPVGKTPDLADGDRTAPLCDISLKIKRELFDYESIENGKRSRRSMNFIDTYKLRDENGDGIWKITTPVENSIFEDAQKKLNKWRKNGVDINEMLRAEEEYSSKAYEALKKASEMLEKDKKTGK